MSPRDREYRSERPKSRKHKSSRHEAQRKSSAKSTPWSKWEWEETEGRWYQWRYNENGNIEFQYYPTANAASYNQKEDYAADHESNQRSQAEYEYPETPLRNDGIKYKSEETKFGFSKFINPNCICTQNCRPGTGCDASTTAHAGPKNVKPCSTQSSARRYAGGDRPWSYRVAPTPDTYVGDIFEASSTLENLGDGLPSSMAALNLGDGCYSKPAQNQHSQQPWQASAFSYNGGFLRRGLPPNLAPVDCQRTSFGRICWELRLFEIKKSGSWQSNTRSVWNPDGLRNNCVCVCVGYIIGMDAKKLAKYLEVEFPPHVKGLGVGEMEWYLGSMPGLNVVILPFDDSDSSKTPTNSVSSALKFLEPYIKRYGHRPFAMGYQREDKTGHCVVVEMSAKTRSQKEFYSYTCYQEKAKGVDMWRDVLRSSIRFAIFADVDAKLLLKKSH